MKPTYSFPVNSSLKESSIDGEQISVNFEVQDVANKFDNRVSQNKLVHKQTHITKILMEKFQNNRNFKLNRRFINVLPQLPEVA